MVPAKGYLDQSIVGDYDWVKGGSSEQYSQDLSLAKDGTATYREKQETYSEAWERKGEGKWSVEDGLVWVVLAEMRKEVKIKKKPGAPSIPGIQDEVKVDYKVAFDIPLDKLQKAPPSGPSAPKNRWRKKWKNKPTTKSNKK